MADGAFLERAQDLSRLANALATVRASGDGRLALVAGEAGVGKTALISRFCDLQPASVRVLRGSCEPVLTRCPLGPFLDVAEVLGGEVAELAGSGSKPHQVAAALMRELHRRAPTVLVLEDMHWADEATLDVLTLLGRRIESFPALVLASFRDDGLEEAHPLRSVLGALSGRGVARLELSRLSAAAVHALADENQVDGAALYRRTGGNPFFVSEVLAAPGDEIPFTVRDAVLARAAGLSGSARRLLEAVAIVPGQAEVSLLEELADESVDRLEECLASGMLISGRGHVAFRHELARIAIEESLAPNRRMTLHRRALAALAASPDGPPDASRLAHHAEAAGDGTAVLVWAVQAADRAAFSEAHREAAAQWARVLRFAGGLPPEQVAPIFEAHSYECYLTDQPDEALHAREQALELWRAIGDVRRQGDCLRWLSRLSWGAADRQLAERHLVEAVGLLESLPPGRELAMAYSSQAQLSMLAAQTADAVAWGERAISLAERLDDSETLAHALNNVGTAQLLSGSEAGRAALERSLAVSLESRLEDDAARAFGNLAASAAMTKDPITAERYLIPGLAYCTEHDLEASELHLLAWLALVRVDSGRWSEATDAAELVIRRARANPIPHVDALTALGRVRARRGDPDAQGPLDEALALAAPTGEQRLARVASARAEAAWLGRTGDVALETDRARHLAWKVGNPWEIGELACWRWRAGIREDVPSGAAEPYALQIAGDWARAAELWTRRSCPYEAALALAAADDESALRRSLAELQGLGARPAAAIVAARLRERGVRGLPRGPRPQTRASPAGLTARQLEVLELVATGMPNAEIAARLFLSPKTVDHHVSAILRKLTVRTRGEASAEAVRLGLAHPR